MNNNNLDGVAQELYGLLARMIDEVEDLEMTGFLASYDDALVLLDRIEGAPDGS
jgi:hypothetical protein